MLKMVLHQDVMITIHKRMILIIIYLVNEYRMYVVILCGIYLGVLYGKYLGNLHGEHIWTFHM